MVVGLIGRLADCGEGTAPSDSIGDIGINDSVGAVVPTGVETTTYSVVDPTNCSSAFWELFRGLGQNRIFEDGRTISGRALPLLRRILT